MHPRCYPGQDHLSAQTGGGCDFFQSLDTADLRSGTDFAPPTLQPHDQSLGQHVQQHDPDVGVDRGQMLPPMSSFSQSFPSPGDYHPKYHSFNESPENDENGIDFNQILGMGCESVAQKESHQSHQQHQQPQQQHDYEMQSLGPPALLYSGFEHESFGAEMQFEPSNTMSHEYLTTDSHVAAANSFYASSADGGYSQSFVLASGGSEYSAASHSIHTMSSDMTDTSHMSGEDQQKSSQSGSVVVAEQHVQDVAGYAFQSPDTLPQTVHQSHHSAGAHPASRSAFSQQQFSSNDFLSFEDTETSESLIDLHSTLVDLLPPTPQPTAQHISRPDDQLSHVAVQHKDPFSHSQSFQSAGAFSFLDTAAPHVELVNDSLVQRVECFKCKVCHFLSEDRTEVLMHISEKHDSQRQPLHHMSVQTPGLSLFSCSSCNKSFASVDECRKHMDTDHQSSSQGLGHESQAAPSAMQTTDQSIAAVSPETQSTSSLSQDQPAEPLVQSLPDDAVDSTSVSTGSKKRKRKPANKEEKVTNKEKKAPKAGKRASRKKVAWSVKLDRELGTFICTKIKCSLRYASMENLQLHEKCHRDDGNGFACCECDEFQSNNWSTVSSHLWTKHKIDMELFQCDQCDYRNYSISIMENVHKPIHSPDKNYLCDCGKRFKNSKQLTNHKNRHEKNKNQAVAVVVPPVPEPVDVPANKTAHKCDVCEKEFPEARPLRLHKDQVHNKKRPYVCHMCDHGAASKGALRVHIRSHTGEKPFKCEDCEYSTSDHNSLRRHKMRHSGERPYKCPFCDYACIQVSPTLAHVSPDPHFSLSSQSSTYKQHLRNKHPDQTASVIHSCSVCGFKTVNEDIFRTHMTEHQNLGPGTRVKHPVPRQNRRSRSDGESSPCSSSSLSPPPLSSSPESPIMHLARGIAGSSKRQKVVAVEPELSVAEIETETPQLTLITSKSVLPNSTKKQNTSVTNL